MGQVGSSWHVSTLYRGFFEQTVRTTAMLTLIFVPYDYARRELDLFQSLWGQALTCTVVCGGMCEFRSVLVYLSIEPPGRNQHAHAHAYQRTHTHTHTHICVCVCVCVCACV